MTGGGGWAHGDDGRVVCMYICLLGVRLSPICERARARVRKCGGMICRLALALVRSLCANSRIPLGTCAKPSGRRKCTHILARKRTHTHTGAHRRRARIRQPERTSVRRHVQMIFFKRRRRCRTASHFSNHRGDIDIVRALVGECAHNSCGAYT